MVDDTVLATDYFKQGNNIIPNYYCSNLESGYWTGKASDEGTTNVWVVIPGE